MNAPVKGFTERAHEAMQNPRLQSALDHLKEGFQVRRSNAFAQLFDPEGLRVQGNAIRAASLSRLDELLLQFEAQVQGNGGHVHWARDAAEGREIITRILKEAGAKTVTKGKSMVTEEIELNPHLVKEGITPVETDLGEYIIQLRNERPSHIVAPAFHLKRDQVEECFRKAHDMLPPDRVIDNRPSLVAEARAMLRKQFEAADAGITGANFLVAQSGTAIIVTNEGNGDLTRLLPKTHIVVTGIEKIVPTLQDVSILLRLLPRSATGQEITSYVSFMSGPKRSVDADGPAAFHVVLVDNGRSAILGTPVREILHCIRCGACMNHCPVYGAIGGHAYNAVYPGPLGAALDPGLDGIAKTYDLPNASSFCGRCETVCPVKIPLTRIMRYWRTITFAQGIPTSAFTRGLKLWAWGAQRPGLYRLGGGIAARVMRLMAGSRARLTSLPVMKGWFAVRDLPKPAAQSFQAQWRKGKR